MAGRKITVVISQAPGKNPTKRQLEEDIATQLMLSGTADVSLIPHLYDLQEDHHGLMWLRSIPGDMVVLGWLYPRAIRWVMDRNSIRGKEGVSLLKGEDDEDEEASDSEGAEPQGIGSVNVPNRRIYTIDLRSQSDPTAYVTEIERIAKDATVPLVSLGMFPGTTPATPPAPTP
ncbi:MAG: 4Fe-4S ferredoxin, partial [Planctomycetales bacterium 12-60-4]